jgi:hypothetical protein
MEAYRFGFDRNPASVLIFEPRESPARYETLARRDLERFFLSPAASPSEELVLVGYRCFAKLSEGIPALQS